MTLNELCCNANQCETPLAFDHPRNPLEPLEHQYDCGTVPLLLGSPPPSSNLPLDPCHDWLVRWHNGHITINTPPPPIQYKPIHTHMQRPMYNTCIYTLYIYVHNIYHIYIHVYHTIQKQCAVSVNIKTVKGSLAREREVCNTKSDYIWLQ